MTRDELEHIIRASADVTDQYEFMIVGSQSILGSVANPQEVFTMSAEADIYPLNAPELADKIEGALGEGSPFHETYGYYAQGVGPETAILPSGWKNRVHRLQSAGTNDRVGYSWTLLTSSCPRPWLVGTRTGASAWRCFSTSTSTLTRSSTWYRPCRSTKSSSAGFVRPSVDGRSFSMTTATKSRTPELALR